MPDTLPADDDAAAEALADAFVEMARQPGALRLAAMQAAGLAREDAPTLEEIAAAFGRSEPAIRRIERRAIEKLRLLLTLP